MVTAEELIVAIRSEGVAETESDLQGVEQSMENTADEAEDSANRMEGFSNKLRGAMKAAVAALAIGAAGLASQVPVLGELFSGLNAVVQAVAFQIDSKLRGSVSNITESLFELSEAINDGDYDKAAKEIRGMGNAFTEVNLSEQVAGLDKEINDFVNAAIDRFDSFTQNVTSEQIESAATMVINIFADGFSRAITNIDWGQFALAIVRLWGKATVGVGSAIVNEIAIPLIDDFVEGLKSNVSDIDDWFAGLGESLSEWASGVASDAREWGVSIVSKLIEGMQSLSRLLIGTVVGIVNGIIETINAAIESLPDKVTAQLGVESLDTVNPQAVFRSAGVADDGDGAGGPGRRPPSNGRRNVTLDGRLLSGSTGRYRADPGRRRGL